MSLFIKPSRPQNNYYFGFYNFYKIILSLFFILNSALAVGQDINWVNFENLSSLQAQEPKLMFIYIHTD